MSRILTRDMLLPGTAALSSPVVIRARTTDGIATFDAATISRFQSVLAGQAMGVRTFDSATYDSLGAFVISELDKLDPMMHDPLIDFSWSRDIDLREDITLGHEFSSFLLSSLATTGGTKSNGVSWASMIQTETPNVALDLNRQRSVLGDWAQEVSYTVFELARAALLQRPLESDKARALRWKWNADLDQVTYIGDTELGGGVRGLVNQTAVSTANVANGAAGTPGWGTKTPFEIQKDVNDLLTAAWTASAWTRVPNRVLLPPAKYSYIVNTVNGSIGNISIMQYLLQNNLATERGTPLQILPLKWLIGAGTGSTDRMVAYTKDYDAVRLPVVPFVPLDTQRQGIYMRTPYVGKIGQIELVRPEFMAYRDGI